MEISPVLQARYLGVLCLFGCVMAFVWGVLGVLFSLAAEKKLRLSPLKFLCDFLIVSAAGAGIIVFSYYFNRGEVRFFAVLGFFCAYLLTAKIFSAVLAKPLAFTFRAILHIIFRIICTILTPLVKTFKYLVNILQKIIGFVRKTLAKFRVLVYNICARKYILKKSKKAFLKTLKRR